MHASIPPRSRPPVFIASELDELLSVAHGHGIVRITTVGTLDREDEQSWSVAVTTAKNVIAIGRGPRLEDALRAALRTLDGQ